MPVQLRDGRSADAAAIADLQNALIAGTTVSFRHRRVSIEDRAAWIAERSAAGFAMLVAEAGPGGAFLGFATYGPFRAGEGYGLTVEHTVALTDAARGAGTGRLLMDALIARARAAGFHAMIGAVSAENRQSADFHRALGFRHVASLPQVGHKFGRWLDLELWQLSLDDRAGPGEARP